MDQSDYPSLPRLNVQNVRLARQCRQVGRAVDRLLDPIEQLFLAATKEDWAAAETAVSALTSLPNDEDNKPLIQAAVAAEHAFRADQPQAIRRQLSKLLAACHARKRDRTR